MFVVCGVLSAVKTDDKPQTTNNKPLMYTDSTPIGDFLDATAAKQPIPGGGSVAALVGALAAAIGEMS